MLVGSRQIIATLTQDLDLSTNGISLKRLNSSKCLGLEIDEFLLGMLILLVYLKTSIIWYGDEIRSFVLILT